MYDLNGKSILVTGGASGIGFGCVREILRVGARAATILDIDEKGGKTAVEILTREFGPNRLIFIKADVTKRDEFEDAFKKSLETWKSIDILINNAAICNDSQWDHEIILNTHSVVQGTLLGLQYMGKDKGGKGGVIVNVSSIACFGGEAVMPVYTGTKHFVTGFSRSLGTSYHYNRTGVRIVVVCPGCTDTPLISQLHQSDTTFLFPQLKQLYEKVAKSFIKQSVVKLAEGVVTCIRNGENGSVWVSENDEPAYEIEIPERKSLQK
ncbi:hypothetical protein ILUMI_19046 [Ignelater luminosus]|uniref:15-hydroxyprostaglandin dehydrogenase [NAD(+)]-like n=1 Tax=Ignelater luminosus TaxID=2038154 RepID=A0A8K0G3K3_IGNLU|nr:hypothetical protein ILUMI_19046 [Ignelater luminosus]